MIRNVFTATVPYRQGHSILMFVVQVLGKRQANYHSCQKQEHLIFAALVVALNSICCHAKAEHAPLATTAFWPSQMHMPSLHLAA